MSVILIMITYCIDPKYVLYVASLFLISVLSGACEIIRMPQLTQMEMCKHFGFQSFEVLMHISKM